MGSKTEFAGNNSLQIGSLENPSSEERWRIRGLRELNLESEQDMNDYFRLLKHPLNVDHFSSPPKDVLDLKNKLLRDKTHAFLAVNGLGQVVGAGGINDAEEAQHDHFLVKVVVDPDYQSTEHIQGRHVGKQVVILLIEKAFYTRASDGRTRLKLDAAIIEGVPGWERMPHILENLGFHFRSRLPVQVDVYDSSLEKIIRKPTVRWEIEREEWMRVRRRTDIRSVLQQVSQ